MAQKLALLSAFLLILGGGWTRPSIADVLLNGSFETAGPGGLNDSADWLEFAGGASSTVSERSITHHRTGSAAHRFYTETQGDAMSVGQVSASTLAAGDEVALEFWVDGTNINNTLVGSLTLQDSASWFETVSLIATQDFIAGTWDQNISSSILVPLTATGPISYSVEISYTQGSPSGIQSEVWLDDAKLNVTSIPEPGIGTIGLAGILILAALRRRR